MASKVVLMHSVQKDVLLEGGTHEHKTMRGDFLESLAQEISKLRGLRRASKVWEAMVARVGRKYNIQVSRLLQS